MGYSTPATNIYRNKVAQAAAQGGTLPYPEKIAFGTGGAEPSPDDESLDNEVLRKDLDSADADGTVLHCTGSFSGEDTEEPITEVGIFDSDGDLMGRRTFAVKQLEPEASLEYTLDFQF